MLAITIVSLLCASCSIFATLVLLTLATLIYLDTEARPYLERFSIRISLHYAVVSMVLSAASISSILVTGHDGACITTAYALALTMSLVNCLAASISVNTFLVLCTKWSSLRARYCIAGIWTVCVCFSTPALGLGYYGRDPERGVCWIVIPSSSLRQGIETLSAGFVCMICVFVSFLCASISLIQLWRARQKVPEHADVNEQSHGEKKRLQIVLRILALPTVSLFICLFVVTSSLESDHKANPVWVVYISQIFLNSPGIVNTISLGFSDPSFRRALRVYRKRYQVHRRLSLRSELLSGPFQNTWVVNDQHGVVTRLSDLPPPIARKDSIDRLLES